MNAGLPVPGRARNPAPELAGNHALLQAVLDPYVNAAHVSLPRTKEEPGTGNRERFAELRYKLIAAEMPTATQ